MKNVQESQLFNFAKRCFAGERTVSPDSRGFQRSREETTRLRRCVRIQSLCTLDWIGSEQDANSASSNDFRETIARVALQIWKYRNGEKWRGYQGKQICQLRLLQKMNVDAVFVWFSEE